MIKQLLFKEATQGFPINGWGGSEPKIIFNVAVGYMTMSGTVKAFHRHGYWYY
ncbi:hypothetical protein ES288_A10G018900v1 [Gossypium darwinii]|uniref:Uncharacterized protein n=1 Tax=Gossypium darwinii TaxID=34276 RepID=A0A5D2EWM8_GOSDA|nr:hypothetical protein ES288_A10G018900v1 [Gossypium darwinii]